MLLFLVSAAALLGSNQADAAPSPPADAQDIVVTGQRLKRIRLKTKTDRKTGLQRCVVKRTSGDPGLDQGVCDVVLACAKTASKAAEMEACVAPRLAEMAARPSPGRDRGK